jgi:uncharacterized protein (DUF1810 family)
VRQSSGTARLDLWGEASPLVGQHAPSICSAGLQACQTTPRMAMTDSFDLDRFVRAQADTYAQALAEIRAGRKRSHWMWFVFPQIAGLGSSAMAVRYAIESLAEAHAYLLHPVLGPRLVECSESACAVDGRSALEIFGTPDDLKLRSSATLFDVSAPGSVFDRLLARFFDVGRDVRTLAVIGRTG